jgi:hypothetical protein
MSVAPALRVDETERFLAEPLARAYGENRDTEALRRRLASLKQICGN